MGYSKMTPYERLQDALCQVAQAIEACERADDDELAAEGKRVYEHMRAWAEGRLSSIPSPEKP
jgi:hypothetical protein